MKRKDIYLFVRKWFQAITNHAPLQKVEGMLVDEGLRMEFPEGKMETIEEFEDWYETVTNTFFDQVHDIRNIEIKFNDNSAYLTILVNWQAHTWEAPAAYSERIDSDAVQTWEIVENENGDLKIKQYIVEALKDNTKKRK